MIPTDGESMAPRDAYIVSMTDKKVSINDFNGFDEVNIDYQTLKVIVSENILSWKSALSNVKGVYLIADKKPANSMWEVLTGMSAYGKGGLNMRKMDTAEIKS